MARHVKLTKAQEEKLAVYRASAFRRATSTVTNRPAAEAAAVELMKDYLWWESPKIQWASTPADAKELVCSRRPDGTQVMAWEDIFWDHANLVDRINEDAVASLRTIRGGYGSTQEDWIARLKMQRNVLLGYPDWNRENELYLLLRYSTVNVVDDIGILATYLSAERAGIVRYKERTSRNLRLHEELLEACFAIYLKPKPYAGENIVLLEKPKQVWIDSGKILDIKW